MKTSRPNLWRGLLAAILLAGCGMFAGPAPTGEQALSSSVVWPAPPARARVRLLKIVTRPEDLGARPSSWQRIRNLVAGKQEDWFIRPTGVVASGETLYVADPGAQAFWVLDGERGRFRKVQQAGQQMLISPVAVALGTSGRDYVADSFLASVFVYDAQLRLERSIATPEWRRPVGLALDARRGRLYVADSGAHRVFIRDLEGAAVGAFGERGAEPGEFNFPTYLTVDPDGLIYVIDSLGFRVQVFTPEGRFVSAFGRHGDTSGDFASPKGVALDTQGHVYVVEALFDAIQIYDRSGQFLLSFGERGVNPGQFWLPAGIYIDRRDRVYVADAYNQRIQIFEFIGGPDGG